jgi:hypothetical protein
MGNKERTQANNPEGGERCNLKFYDIFLTSMILSELLLCDLIYYFLDFCDLFWTSTKLSEHFWYFLTFYDMILYSG